jgi:hypothetical protein
MTQVSEMPQLYQLLTQQERLKPVDFPVPEGVTAHWRNIGTFHVGKQGLVLIDPNHFIPEGWEKHGIFLPWKARKAEFWVQTLEDEEGDVLRICQALICRDSHHFCPTSIDEKLEIGKVSVDSDLMMIADLKRVSVFWKSAGPLSICSLGNFTADPELVQIKDNAAALLNNRGYTLERRTEASMVNYLFTSPLSWQQVAQANEFLQKHHLGEEVTVVTSQSYMEIVDQLDEAAIALRHDGESGYLYAFKPGMGNGVYRWDAINDQGEPVGYLCNFFEDGKG